MQRVQCFRFARIATTNRTGDIKAYFTRSPNTLTPGQNKNPPVTVQLLSHLY